MFSLLKPYFVVCTIGLFMGAHASSPSVQSSFLTPELLRSAIVFGLDSGLAISFANIDSVLSKRQISAKALVGSVACRPALVTDEDKDVFPIIAPIASGESSIRLSRTLLSEAKTHPWASQYQFLLVYNLADGRKSPHVPLGKFEVLVKVHRKGTKLERFPVLLRTPQLVCSVEKSCEVLIATDIPSKADIRIGREVYSRPRKALVHTISLPARVITPSSQLSVYLDGVPVADLSPAVLTELHPVSED